MPFLLAAAACCVAFEKGHILRILMVTTRDSMILIKHDDGFVDKNIF